MLKLRYDTQQFSPLDPIFTPSLWCLLNVDWLIFISSRSYTTFTSKIQYYSINRSIFLHLPTNSLLSNLQGPIQGQLCHSYFKWLNYLIISCVVIFLLISFYVSSDVSYLNAFFSFHWSEYFKIYDAYKSTPIQCSITIETYS